MAVKRMAPLVFDSAENGKAHNLSVMLHSLRLRYAINQCNFINRDDFDATLRVAEKQQKRTNIAESKLSLKNIQ